jgi:hypothetical protein
MYGLEHRHLPSDNSAHRARSRGVRRRVVARLTDIFVFIGADGSLRAFDLRSLEHSTILYETPVPKSVVPPPVSPSPSASPSILQLFQTGFLERCTAVLDKPERTYHRHRRMRFSATEHPRTTEQGRYVPSGCSKFIWGVIDAFSDADTALEFKKESQAHSKIIAVLVVTLCRRCGTHRAQIAGSGYIYVILLYVIFRLFLLILPQ